MASQQDRLSKAIDHLWSHRNSIIWILIITALAAFTALPLAAQKGYMDEKALVVGAMGLSIHEIQGADSIYNGLKQQHDINNIYNLLTRASELSINHSNAETLPPPPVWQAQNKNNNSTSRCPGSAAVHAVIPGGRGDRTEALVLAFPVTTGSDTAKLTAAIGVQAARHMASVSWLAKDLVIIFLEVEALDNLSTMNTTRCTHSTALDALESWLREMDLIGIDSEILENNKKIVAATAGKVNTFGSLIQQGIIVDIRTVAATEARLSVHGYNGQLPNLDLVALTKKNLDYYTNFPVGVGVDVGRAPAVKTSKDTNSLRQRIRTSVSFAWYLALGKPTGAHAALLKRGADALSIVFTRPELSILDFEDKSTAPSYTVKDSDVLYTTRNALNAIEMIIRTCNNLHERLHHANALYILIDADHFVNVGACMAPPGILLAALLLLVAQYLPTLSIKSDGEKKGAMLAVALHATVIGIAVILENNSNFSKENGTLVNVVGTTAVSGVLVYTKIGASWASCLSFSNFSSGGDAPVSKAQGKRNRSSPLLHSFIGVCSILVLIEASALLLWRWALSFTLLALTVPILHSTSLMNAR